MGKRVTLTQKVNELEAQMQKLLAQKENPLYYIPPSQPPPRSPTQILNDVMPYSSMFASRFGRIAKERTKMTFDAVKHALRLMAGVTFTLSETSFKINIDRSFYRKEIVVNLFEQRDFLGEIKYNDANNMPRVAAHGTLAMLCSDLTALVMFYAMR